jgi:hypothetical protein
MDDEQDLRETDETAQTPSISEEIAEIRQSIREINSNVAKAKERVKRLGRSNFK